MRIAKVEDPTGRRIVHEAASKRIVGYGPPHAAETASRTHQLLKLFNDRAAPDPSLMIVATDDAGTTLHGGIVIETPPTAELAAQQPEQARIFAQTHRALAALFVLEHAEGTGVARRLLSEGSMESLIAGARYLDGFVDIRNASSGFYQAIGAHVMPRTIPLPPRPPANVPQRHLPGIDGHWFYLDLWQTLEGHIVCSHCDTLLAYSHTEDRLVCAHCLPTA